MKNKTISRRSVIKSMSAACGLSQFPIFGLSSKAYCQGAEKPSLVMIFLQGGYNAIFTSADSFVGSGSFGVTNQNMLQISDGFVVDSSFDALGDFSKTHMAAVGVRHGITSHAQAPRANLQVNGSWAPLELASALGGSGSIKAAQIGPNAPAAVSGAVEGVSLQPVNDTQTVIDALGGGTPDPSMPDRKIAAEGIKVAQKFSSDRIKKNPLSLESAMASYGTAFDTLIKPAEVFNLEQMQAAYGVTGTSVNSFAEKMAATELMIRSDANVSIVTSPGWDTHGDRTGQVVRSKMTQEILPPLIVFLDRMLNLPDRNVVVTILGDFARSLPGSDHAPVLSATVFGKYVKPGTTGKVDQSVGLPDGTPNIPGYWGYLSEALKAPVSIVQKFGGNPHKIILDRL